MNDADNTIQFRLVESEVQRAEAAALIREYLTWLNRRVTHGYGLEFDVEAMVNSDLSDGVKFHPPGGRFFLACYRGEIAGVGCLMKLNQYLGEIQRMYVPGDFRGKGVGRAIVMQLIEAARSIGYKKLRLESLEFLDSAHALYKSVGFRPIDPYAQNSMESYQAPDQLPRYYAITVFMEMDL